MARDDDSPVATKVAAGAPDALLTMDMVKAGIEAFDEGASAGEQAALVVTKVFYRMLSLSNFGKPNSLCISSSNE
jgi:hypothetical protein